MRGRTRRLIVAVGVLAALAALPAAADAVPPPGLPQVVEPVEFTSTGVRLKGMLNPEGVPTFYYFVYAQPGEEECAGPLPCGATTPREGPLTGDAAQEVSAEVTGLQPGQTYLYWLIAENEAGKRNSSPGQFTVPTAAANAPTIESESISHISPTDATLEAQIDVEGLEQGAYYQFQVVKNTSEYLPELACPEPSVQLDGHDGCGIPGPGGGHPTPGALPIGFIPSNTMEPAKSASVSLDLAAGDMTLQPGTTYHYRVLAVKKVQSEDTLDWVGPAVAGPDRMFTTPRTGAPVVDSVSVSHLTPTDATLEGQVNTEDQATIYEFLLWYNPCAVCEDLGPVIKVDLPSGLLLPSLQDQSVSLDLNSVGVTLKQGAEYTYTLRATNASGSTEAQSKAFQPPAGMIDPPGPTVTPGPVSNEPQVRLAGGQQPASGGSNSPAPTGGSASAGVPSKPAHGKPSTKHGKRRRHEHHGKHLGKGHKTNKR